MFGIYQILYSGIHDWPPKYHHILHQFSKFNKKIGAQSVLTYNNIVLANFLVHLSGLVTLWQEKVANKTLKHDPSDGHKGEEIKFS